MAKRAKLREENQPTQKKPHTGIEVRRESEIKSSIAEITDVAVLQKLHDECKSRGKKQRIFKRIKALKQEKGADQKQNDGAKK